MNGLSQPGRDNLAVLLEGASYLFFLAAGAVALQLSWISMDTAVRLAVLLLLVLLILAWKRFDGGRHPCFLFLALLVIFQAGRLVGQVAAILPDPFRIELQTAVPFDVSDATAQLTVCLVLLSAICIYLPCRWDFRPVRLKIGWEQYWLPAAYVLLALTFPAVLYKNYEYLNYVRTHGGYFAIYTDSQAVLQTVGFLPRLLSLLASNTFLVVFVMERRSRLLFAVSCVFFSSSLLELLMGFRGKVFILVLTLWFLHILKTGKRFRLLPLAISASLLSLVGVVVAGFRENTEVALLSPLGFLSAQGISMQVTELAIELKQAFHTHALYYFWNEFKVGFYPGSQFGPGQLFANDLSIALNATAYDLGFGTGSAYLAEAYIAGGIFFVAAASAFVGLALRFLHKLGGHFIGAVVVAVVMPSIIYMPRCGLIEPVSVGTRNLISLSLVFPILWAIRWVAQIGWHRLHIYEENS